MTRSRTPLILTLAAAMLAGGAPVVAQQRKTLPAPRTEGGKPLMEALKLRRSASRQRLRSFQRS